MPCQGEFKKILTFLKKSERKSPFDPSYIVRDKKTMPCPFPIAKAGGSMGIKLERGKHEKRC
jgi:hypothetical protein